MRRLLATGAYLTAVAVFALAFYEVTAKSPRLVGQPLPGWHACLQAEVSTRWQPRTGFGPLDHLMHEGEEALVFYGLRGRGPARARLSSKSPSKAR